MLRIKANVPFKQKIVLWHLCLPFPELLNLTLKSLAIIQEKINLHSGLPGWT